MKMTGTDIRTQEFPKKLRGYDTLDVIAFLQFVADEVDIQNTKYGELSEENEKLSVRLKELQDKESLLEKSLQAVNELREEVKTNSKTALDHSRAESERIVAQAEEAASRILEEAEWNSRRLKDEVATLEKLRDKTLKDLAGLLRTQTTLLESEAQRLDIDISEISASSGSNIVPINKKAESEGS
ncbi:MAG: DivIVA domain-containing protein [Nitrospinaceae bacterium]|jgi:cell division initiation protein|nr:DivIVA domain-containing protein [Nitrospinaceae bacterium]MBT3820153.1 DivIVA domain-containing protein [Nitrospinaceae bacterium]MBT4093106.1 DivIVA domain-containing protein [Nitrospinaceae bacterium]MBT4429370.1 DivIVA domain-containing protein [Nitrospinaceae bacterium]MBT5367565.1 DivIVA domain-containing protein [Nitrospinaceae bacterium]